MKRIISTIAMSMLVTFGFAQTKNEPKTNTKMKIVFVVSNQVKSETTGYSIGFWLSELAQPFYTFQEAGYEITVASPDGGKIIFDSWSDPESPNARELDLVTTGFKHNPKTVALMENTIKLDEIKVENFDGIFVVGGLGPMQTFYNNEKLHKLFAQFYEAGKASATICHGSAILLKTKLSNGKLLSEGKTWTGFCNAEEDIVDKGAGKKMQPFRIEDEAKKLNTNYVTGGVPYKSYAVADGNLISGQQGSSGAETAKLVIKYLNNKTINKNQTMENSNQFYGKTIQHTWTEGAFAGGSFKNQYRSDNSASLECVAGGYKGTKAELKNYSAKNIGNNLWLMSWLEESGYSVSIVFDFATNKVTGTISKPNAEFYPVSGTIDSVETTKL